MVVVVFFFQAEDGIRDLVRSRGLGDVYKRQSRRRVDRPSGVVLPPEQVGHPVAGASVGATDLALSLIHI